MLRVILPCALAAACSSNGSTADAGATIDGARGDAAPTADAAAADATPTDASPCAYAIIPTSRTYDTRTASADPNTICMDHTNTAAITVTAGCSWSALVDPGTGAAGWLAVVSGGGPTVGTGAGQAMQFRALANAHAASARTGTITLLDGGGNPTNAVLTVSQIGDPTNQCP